MTTKRNWGEKHQALCSAVLHAVRSQSVHEGSLAHTWVSTGDLNQGSDRVSEGDAFSLWVL